MRDCDRVNLLLPIYEEVYKQYSSCWHSSSWHTWSRAIAPKHCCLSACAIIKNVVKLSRTHELKHVRNMNPRVACRHVCDDQWNDRMGNSKGTDDRQTETTSLATGRRAAILQVTSRSRCPASYETPASRLQARTKLQIEWRNEGSSEQME